MKIICLYCKYILFSCMVSHTEYIIILYVFANDRYQGVKVTLVQF